MNEFVVEFGAIGKIVCMSYEPDWLLHRLPSADAQGGQNDTNEGVNSGQRLFKPLNVACLLKKC